MKITKKQIREYLGHDGSNCIVVIHSGGWIERYGSTDPTDRSMDYWHGCGMDFEIKAQMRNEQNFKKGK